MKEDFKIAWRNIWRNPRRSALTIAAIAFASILLVFMISFQLGSYETMINSSVKISTGHIQILAKNYHEKKNMRLVISEPRNIIPILKKIPEISAFSFRANGFALFSSSQRTSGVAIIGIDPIQEVHVSRIKKLVTKGQFIDTSGDQGVIIGQLLSKNLKLKIGNEVTVLGQGRDGSIAASVLIVKGIFHSGIDELDRSVAYVYLETFQEIFHMDQTIHEIVINAHHLTDVESIKNEIKSALYKIKSHNNLVVLDWMELVPGLLQSIQLDLFSGIIMYIILVIVVAFSILNTFLMAVFERTKEFGVLMAIGTPPLRLVRFLLLESLGLTVLGVSIGIIMGCGLTIYFQIYGIDISGTSEILSQLGISGRLYPKLSVWSTFSGPLVVFCITFLAALYPALKIRKLRPIEALVYT